jgi:hypothetical protein
LKACQVNDVGNLVAFDDRHKRVWFGYVAGDHSRSRNLAIIHNQAQAPSVGALIEDDDTSVIR